MSVFAANTDVIVPFEFYIGTTPEVPATISYFVTSKGVEVVPETLIGTPATSVEILIDAANNALGADETRGSRSITVTWTDSTGSTHVEGAVYILEALRSVRKGVNSFGEYDELVLEESELPELISLASATQSARKSALINAYYNVIQLPFDTTLLGLDDIALDSEAGIALVEDKHRKRMMRAQAIEADNLLGGNPVEDRRKAGMISDSAGESAHFFRTGKPLDLPCCRKSIQELRGLLTWALKKGA